MDERQYRRNTKLLWVLISASTVYSLWFYYLHTLSGNHTLDGALSVVFGLYICSRPAANAIDLLFFERGAIRRMASGWSTLQWLGLNVLTLLMGWVVIAIGTTLLASRAG